MADPNTVFCVFCLSIRGWFYVYGSWLFLNDAIRADISLALIGIVVLFVCVYSFRLAAPSSEAVELLFGPESESDLAIRVDGKCNNTHRDSHRKNKLTTIAHRGAGLDAPENSLSAFRLAKRRNCGAVEFDVGLTADGVAVLFHDDTVDRVTTESGRLQDLLWAEVKELDISVKHPFRDRFPGERIPLFEDAVLECVKLKLKMIIDLKPNDTRIVHIIVDMFARIPELYTSALVSSFNPVILYMIRLKDPKVICSVAYRPGLYTFEQYSGQDGTGRSRTDGVLATVINRMMDIGNEWLVTNVMYHFLGISAILLHKDIITLDAVYGWRRLGIRVIPWTVNLPLEKQYCSKILKVPYITDTLIGGDDEYEENNGNDNDIDGHDEN